MMGTISVFQIMFDWSLIWLPFMMTPVIMTLGAALAVLWMFREKRGERK